MKPGSPPTAKGALQPREVTAELLAEIDAFCFEHNISASKFGTAVTCNSAFVKSLRLDRPRLYERTILKTRAFMVNYR
jgi:hypothetical protein